MTTIVNTPPAPKESGGGVGIIIGIIVLLIVGYLFFMYGIPVLRQAQMGSPQINIPSQIDVNINQPK